MGKENFQKIKLMKIWEILRQETDEEKHLGTYEIIAKLAETGIECDRKTLYKDIDALNEYGYEVLADKSGRTNMYYVLDRSFEVPELKILIDAVNASKFISKKRTEELIDKIAEFGGSRRADILKNNVRYICSTKTKNKAVIYSVDTIDNAINKGKKVSFRYYDLAIGGKRIFRKDGERYIVNPLALVVNEENYYLVCYNDKYKNITNYRIDRMDGVREEKEDITDAPCARQFNLNNYKTESFSMFSGKEVFVEFIFDKSIYDVILDKFGDNVQVYEDSSDDKIYHGKVKIRISPVFYSWLTVFGTKIKLVSPQKVVEEYRQTLIDSLKIYE